jgi:hypothetical protein
MWQIDKYTNIRYHIYKELSKNRKLQEKKGPERINEIAIPIITGIVVVFITNRFQPWLNEFSVFLYFVAIVITIIAYGILLEILKIFFYKYEKDIKPNRSPIIKKNAGNKEFSPEIEEYAAKFNYEVTYLVESAYCQINEINTQDNLILKISLLNTLFCIKNAIRKIQESLLWEPGNRINNGLVSYSMIRLVLEMIFITLTKIQKYSSNNNKLYMEEIEFVLGKYKDVVEKIKEDYNIKIDQKMTPEQYFSQ